MRKVLSSLFLCLILLCSTTMTAFADGNGNVDGGGGNLNQGTEAYNWPGSSYQGVRVTVVDATSGAIICNPVDFTNKNIASIAGRIIHFGKVSKIQYRNGASLTPQSSGYVYYAPTNAMPPVVSSNSNPASIAAIKRYFCSEGAASMVANRTGINVTSLTDGTYKLVIEPVIYLIYNHLYYAMTTTEAGLYNRMLGGDLGAHFPTVVMKNLALALFLENADLGFQAWTGSKTTARTTDEMINILGIGIISYQGAPVTDVVYDAEYRIDTDVITAVTLSTTNEINSDSTATVSFSINGRTYHMTGIVIPANRSQLVWVKWHTPSSPGEVNISISTNKGTLSNTSIHANVVDMNGNPPPDPTADDRNDSFRTPSIPNRQNVTSLSWGVWSCRWHANWVWVPDWDWESGSHSASCPANCSSSHGHWVDNGEYEDQGWYDYTWHSYSALTAELSDIQYPFKFLALSRPVDISPLITEMGDMLKEAEEKRKEILRQEILQMGSYALSGEIVERQFYIAIWDKQDEGSERDMLKKASLLCEKFAAGGVVTDILTKKEIVRLVNLVNNPSYTHLEDAETSASIPTLKGVM